MKLFHKGIFRDPNPEYKMLNHYSVYNGWWIEERTAITKDDSLRPDQLPPPEFRVYANLQHAKTHNFRGPISFNLATAKRMIDDWGQRGYVVQHFLKED